MPAPCLRGDVADRGSYKGKAQCDEREASHETVDGVHHAHMGVLIVPTPLATIVPALVAVVSESFLSDG